MTKDLLLLGDKLLLFHNHSVSCLDLSIPGQPVLISSITLTTTGFYYGKALYGSYVLSMYSNGTVYCVDYTNPSAPVLTDSVNAGQDFYSLAVSGDTAWLSGSEACWRYIDLNNPYNMQLGGDVPGTEDALIQAASGDLIFAAQEYVLKIFQRTSSHTVTLASTYDLGIGYINGIETGNGFILIDHVYILTDYPTYRYVRMDVSDPQNPVAGYSQGYSGPGGIAYSDPHFYVFGGSQVKIYSMSQTGGYPVYLSTYQRGTATEIVANSSNMILVEGDGRVSIAPAYNSYQGYLCSSFYKNVVTTMAVNDSLLLITTTGIDWEGFSSGVEKLDIYNLSDPCVPSQIYSQTITSNYLLYCQDVCLRGNLAWYAMAYQGIWVMDISDPTDVQVISVTDFGNKSYTDIEVKRNIAYCVWTEYNNSSTLEVFNVANPAAPVLSGSLALPFEAKTLAVADGYVYLGGESRNLLVVDASSVQSPTLIGSLDLHYGWINDIAVKDYAAVILCDFGLKVVDTAVPDRISVVGSFLDYDIGDSFVLQDSLAVCVRTLDLGIYDLSAAYALCEAPAGEPGDLPVWSYPNPFRQSLSLCFDLPQAARVGISVYNIRGEKVLSVPPQDYDSGEQRYLWDGRNATGGRISPGIYLFKLDIGKHSYYHKTTKL